MASIADQLHVDTNFLVATLRNSPREIERWQGWVQAGATVSISTVAWFEFACGPLQSGEIDAAEGLLTLPAVAFDAVAADMAATLFNALGRRRPLFRDCMIGATAIVHRAALATLNTRDFAPMQAFGLQLAVP